MLIDLASLPAPKRHQFLQYAVAPRPVCFASTVNSKGEVNLSPFSFFNMFSSTPPILIFSPSRRVRDNTVKHTLENVLEVPEVVINIVDYDMVQQISLASCEYGKGVNEFIKSGFTPEPSTRVRPPMVKESKIRMECRVQEVKPLGTEGGAGNLVICEVLCMHIADDIVDQAGMIDQRKLKHVARLGGDWYCVVDESNLFEVEKPNTHTGIGVDALPASIRLSPILTGNHLGQLGNVSEYPLIDPAFRDEKLTQIILYYSTAPEEMEKMLHHYAAELLAKGKVREAWQVLLAQA
jgi:flavin reductase (DIM6/NTAB) family NADH-FMN oxidoreductase RutF